MPKCKPRELTALVCAVAIVVGLAANPSFSQPSSVTGRIAGAVIDKASGLPVSGARVEAKLITTNELFTSPGTDGLGGYLIAGVPAGIYALSVALDGATFPVPELVDVRMVTSYLLEACFELDGTSGRSGTASLGTQCSSGLYAESQVVTLGPHRYFREASASTTTQEISIDHGGVSCVVSDRHPLLLAGLAPSQFVALGRVFFRAPPHPDYYYVDMYSAGTSFQAILPRPSPETSEFIYYIEAIDTSANPVQTMEFTVLVDDCDEDPEAAYFQGDDPGIVIGSASAGAAMTPPGFLPGGIASFISSTGAIAPVAGGTAAAVSAGGVGLGALGLNLIVIAGAGATAWFVLRSTDENEASAIQ